MPTMPPDPHPRRRRLPRPLCALALVLLLTGAGAAASSGGLATTPFRPLVDDLLERFHGVVEACDLVAGAGDVCFAVKPGSVAQLAEVLEGVIGDQAGAVERSEWTSANGAHRVVLMLADESWGTLELWLSERPDRLVEGWFERRPRPRD